MELTVITLAILLGIAIIALGAIVIVQMVITSKDKNELEKLIKARSLQEYVAYAPTQEEEVEEPSPLVSIDEIGEYVGVKKGE